MSSVQIELNKALFMKPEHRGLKNTWIADNRKAISIDASGDAFWGADGNYPSVLALGYSAVLNVTNERDIICSQILQVAKWLRAG